MRFWGVVFIVFMCLWLFLGCYSGYSSGNGGQPNIGPLIGGTILPWACVAILGYLLLGDKPTV